MAGKTITALASDFSRFSVRTTPFEAEVTVLDDDSGSRLVALTQAEVVTATTGAQRTTFLAVLDALYAAAVTKRGMS